VNKKEGQISGSDIGNFLYCAQEASDEHIYKREARHKELIQYQWTILLPYGRALLRSTALTATSVVGELVGRKGKQF